MEKIYRNLKKITDDEILREQYDSMEKIIICQKKKCKDIKNKYLSNPEIKELKIKQMKAKNNIELDNINKQLIKIKIVKDYYDCMYKKCKIEIINTTKAFLKYIEKYKLHTYKKTKRELYNKLINIINKKIDDITYSDIINIHEIKFKLRWM
jgi:DNA-directed RNA polymerase subunit F